MSIFQELLGCQWGRDIATKDDSEPCSEQAVQIVVLHAGEHERGFKLCERHRDRILNETQLHEVAS